MLRIQSGCGILKNGNPAGPFFCVRTSGLSPEKKKKIVDSEMAQGIKLVTIKPVDPCWVPGTHRVDGESKLLQAVL